MPRTSTITHLVQATALVELPGGTVLTDPCLAPHPVLRLPRPGLTGAELPPLAAVVGGHGVPDHWQPRSLRRSPGAAGVPVLVARPAMARSARRAGLARAEVLRWGETRRVGDDLAVTSVPGERITGMTTSAYLLRSGGITVLVGTEARGLDPIRAVARRHRVDVALLPVDGARLLGRRLVMDAATAVEAARILGAVLVPIHHGQGEVPGLLRCPTGLDDVRAAAGPDGPEVRCGARGEPVVVTLPDLVQPSG